MSVSISDSRLFCFWLTEKPTKITSTGEPPRSSSITPFVTVIAVVTALFLIIIVLLLLKMKRMNHFLVFYKASLQRDRHAEAQSRRRQNTSQMRQDSFQMSSRPAIVETADERNSQYVVAGPIIGSTSASPFIMRDAQSTAGDQSQERYCSRQVDDRYDTLNYFRGEFERHPTRQLQIQPVIGAIFNQSEEHTQRTSGNGFQQRASSHQENKPYDTLQREIEPRTTNQFQHDQLHMQPVASLNLSQ